MDYVLGWLLGYVTYNLIAPTSLGKILDKVSIPPSTPTNAGA